MKCDWMESYVLVVCLGAGLVAVIENCDLLSDTVAKLSGLLHGSPLDR